MVYQLSIDKSRYGSDQSHINSIFHQKKLTLGPVITMVYVYRLIN